MSEKKSKSGASRTRNFATVVYPESAPSNWLEIISESKVPVLVSPLHDADKNPTGEPKKPHYHVISMYDNVKTREQAEEFFKSFGGVGVEVVNSPRAYARYLCHLDNPEKARYQESEVKSFGGIDYFALIGTMADKKKAIKEMLSFIHAEDVTCFADLLDYAAENRDDWFDALTNSCAYIIKEYIKSYTWKFHHTEEK